MDLHIQTIRKGIIRERMIPSSLMDIKDIAMTSKNAKKSYNVERRSRKRNEKNARL